jgi:hypothetical protein
MELLLVTLAVLCVGVLAQRWGVDSTDGYDSPEWARRRLWSSGGGAPPPRRAAVSRSVTLPRPLREAQRPLVSPLQVHPEATQRL